MSTSLLSSISELIPFPHEQLPPPFDLMVSKLLLADVPNADYYLAATCIFLTILVFVQLKAFARPPPVPLKRLPKRPALCILFKPDDISSTSIAAANSSVAQQRTEPPAAATPSSTPSRSATVLRDNVFRTSPFHHKRTTTASHRAVGDSKTDEPENTPLSRFHNNDDYDNEDDILEDQGGINTTPPLSPQVETVHDDDDDDDDDSFTHTFSSSGKTGGNETATPMMHATHGSLPDSFAPLLSSSQVEVLRQHLTADLLHAVQFKGSLRLRPGRHEIPLDKDNSRPQLVLEVPASGGVRLSAIAMIGSDGFTSQQDLDVTVPTPTRSKPMVKHAGLVLDPPLPLANVAPTLIHFPTLFQDNWMHSTLRHIQIVRLSLDLIISISSLLEKCLWILESVCQIHLSKVRITPLYKGVYKNKSDPPTVSTTTTNNTRSHDQMKSTFSEHPPAQQEQQLLSPQWRLTLAFSGHVLLFGWIPIPFISVTLPTFIIPQPHALLEYLLSPQPLASAKLRRENIAEERIALAALHTVESWQVDVQVVATPPSVGIDVTLPGGVAVALELGLGRDHQAGRKRQGTTTAATNNAHATAERVVATSSGARGHHAGKSHGGGGGDEASSVNSMSSWTTAHMDASGSHLKRRGHIIPSPIANNNSTQFDANTMVPWSLEFSAKGSISREKLSVHILKMAARHQEHVINVGSVVESRFGAQGSLAIWKVRSDEVPTSSADSLPLRRSYHRRSGSTGHPELQTEDSPSVAAILLFPNETTSFHRNLRLVQYDYVFDVFDDSQLDAITVSVGATHPMLNGGTMVTTVFDSIYAYGSVSARENSILDPNEMHRKRNILRHLPATDFQFGIQNIYIPPESESYSDDGQTLFLPELEGGRMRVHLLGGTEPPDDISVGSNNAALREAVAEGIKLVADFEVPSLVVRTEALVKEFPELDIFEGVKLRTVLAGIISGGIRAHLRPQKLTGAALSTTGPNVFNPLEAYEIDFSRSSLSIKMKELTVSLGHRRVIFPSESTFLVNIIESVVDMGFEGKTQCELTWDFQGLSPILQVTSLGHTPEDADPENKQQVSILVGPLRQGRLSFHVSSVGGISVQKAATSREDKEGLYDWKFFNALVSPDDESPGRILDVLHDKRTMGRLLQVMKLINEDLHNILHYLLRQVWRAKEIFDQEGVSDPAHAIPMYKLTRLISIFLTGDVDKIDTILPIVRKVISGEGLDVVKVKELIRDYIEQYNEWAPEIDRAVRWADVALGPMAASQPYIEEHVLPLSELPYNAAKFEGIPSAAELYQSLLDKPQLPLDPVFSNLVGRVAPYLSFKQIEFILEARQPTDWQPSDLRRIRYVYSIKKKVLEIAESYGGLSFLPQSFLLSVFLGEATRSSHRVSQTQVVRSREARSRGGRVGRSRRDPLSESHSSRSSSSLRKSSSRLSILSRLRRRRGDPIDSQLRQVIEVAEDEPQTPAERVASFPTSTDDGQSYVPQNLYLDVNSKQMSQETYELGDSLLGPQDVAILLQAGLTSVMKSSTAVQLNQRMLLDLICSQPRSFAVAVLAEIGTPSGQGSPRSLTSALMALLELDQSSFTSNHKIDMHALLESWLPGLKMPRRDDYMAGGRWARQSYYTAMYSVASNILDDAESYMALKGYVQRVRRTKEGDPLPQPRNEEQRSSHVGLQQPQLEDSRSTSKLVAAVADAMHCIHLADEAGKALLEALVSDMESSKSKECAKTVSLYRDAFDACANVLRLDKHAFHADWFRRFYKRNYDALMIKSMYDNVIQNVDSSRYWLHALRRGAKLRQAERATDDASQDEWEEVDELFLKPDNVKEQVLIDAILDATIYEETTREELRKDPLVRLLISNPPGKYDFVIVTAMGVITEGKKGLELKDAFARLEELRGVKVIRSDTGTARTLEFNASKIEEAIEIAVSMKKPYGLLGYSQGCANALMAESTLLSGSPKQQEALSRINGGLICRQLLFSAANGSFHGPAMEKKIQRLIVMGEEFFKYQQGYFSRAFSTTVLETLNDILDSSHFHKFMGGAQSFLPDGCRAFWREAQHMGDVPTCTLKGVLEPHTTPESLEMLSNLLSKQSGSHLHDSQVHVFDAVGHPCYHHNRNGYLLKKCAVGEGAVQRTHHWSPLSDEVSFVRTVKDLEQASFDCAKDRHVFPWVDVNARFGFIKYMAEEDSRYREAHPLKLITHQLEKQKIAANALGDNADDVASSTADVET